MNVIFCDVDGVLNSGNHLAVVYHETGKSHSGFNYPFDPKCMMNLYHLVTLTDSKIIISSKWRIYEEDRNRLLSELEKYDLKDRVIGYTPHINFNKKDEIVSVLNSFSVDVGFIIIDDERINGFEPNFIKVNPKTGLTQKNVRDGIKLLNGINRVR